jgi:hypothetical protein
VLCANCNSAKSYKGQEHKILSGKYKSKCPHFVCRESYKDLKIQCQQEGVISAELMGEADRRLLALLLKQFLPLSQESILKPTKPLEHSHSCLRCGRTFYCGRTKDICTIDADTLCYECCQELVRRAFDCVFEPTNKSSIADYG